jgi:hypothetical protein
LGFNRPQLGLPVRAFLTPLMLDNVGNIGLPVSSLTVSGFWNDRGDRRRLILPAVADTSACGAHERRARRRQCEVLRLRNLTMIENIRRAADPAWGERLERQQVLARLGRTFGRAEDPRQAILDHADTIKPQTSQMLECKT